MKKHLRNIFILFLLTAIVGIATYYWNPPQSAELKIVMLDIGQGDALYIRTPQGKDILVDGGPDRNVLYELGEVMPPYDHTLELVVATHPDMDHIAGLTALPEAYTIEKLMRSPVHHTTAFAQDMDAWEERGIEVFYPHGGQRIDIEQDLWLEILHPNSGTIEKEINDNSIVFILHYKEFSMLFTGDIADIIEEQLVALPTTIDVDILKVAHHGSKSSTAEEFVQATKPEIALISVGVGNKFGHPHFGPLSRLQQAGARILRTDTDGRITCTTNGNTYDCSAKE